MRMRQSLAEWEQAFANEVDERPALANLLKDQARYSYLGKFSRIISNTSPPCPWRTAFMEYNAIP